MRNAKFIRHKAGVSSLNKYLSNIQRSLFPFQDAIGLKAYYVTEMLSFLFLKIFVFCILYIFEQITEWLIT
jgi:hypothetical protein